MSNLELGLKSYPLVDQHFGAHLRKLVEVRQTDPGYKGYFVDHAFYSGALETRLGKVEGLGLTQAIVNEVGDTDDAQELDRRLMDAWAEVRTLDQLQREGFTDIQKVRDIADFTAEQDGVRHAVQVTHINRRIDDQLVRRNEPGQRNVSPCGPIDEVRTRFANATYYLFWDSMQQKNSSFADWPEPGWRRCIVLVTNQEKLQVRLVRHIACQQLRDCIHYLQERHFEELYWLLDNGNGARFLIGKTADRTQCLADWKDEHPGLDVTAVSRREVNLDTCYPSWRAE
jgi:hypothetical protein